MYNLIIKYMETERMNVLKPDKKATLVTLLKNKISQREISRKAGIDRKTIRKYGRQFDIM